METQKLKEKNQNLAGFDVKQNALGKNGNPEFHNSCILHTFPPERVQALTAADWPQLEGEFIPFAAFPYKPSQKHINMVINDTMSESEKKQAVKELASDSLIRFKVGKSKEELIMFASILRGEADKHNIDAFVELENGKIGVRKGLICKTEMKRFSLKF